MTLFSRRELRPRSFLRGLSLHHLNLEFSGASMSIPSSKDRTNFCVFSFADGRRCNMPPVPASDYGLCYFHHQQYIERLNKQYAGEQICLSLPSGISTACD